jgi:hemoglobin/transferrin/lactoferrin receptor protein
MDFHYLDPVFARDKGTLFSGGAFGRFASANTEKTFHLHVNSASGRFASVAAATYSDFGDMRRGNIVNPFYPDWGKRFEYVERQGGEDVIVPNDDPNIQIGTAYKQLNLLAKLSYRVNDHWEARYGLYFTTSSDIPRYDRLSEYRNGVPRYAEWYYGPQQWMMNSLKLEYNNLGAFVDHGRLTIAYQNIDEDRISRRFESADKRHQEEDVTVWNANLDLDKELVPGVHRLFYGVEATYNNVESSAFYEDIESGGQRPAGTRYPDGGTDMYTFAGYLSYKWDISPQWLFSAGTRYSHEVLSSSLVSKEFYDFPYDAIDINTGALTGSMGIVFRPGDQWQFNLNLSSGFRAPNLDDVGKIFDSSPGTLIVPNPDAQPEYAYTGELTVMKEFGSTSYFSLTGFYTELTDALVIRDFMFNGSDSLLYDGVKSNVQATQNAGEANIYGASAMFSADVSADFTVSSALTYTYGHDKSNDVPLDHIPPLFGSTRFVYRMDRFRAELAIAYNDWKRLALYSPSGEDNIEDATDFGTPAWCILSLRTSYQLTSSLQVNLGLENLLDVHYRPFASGVSGPGRNLVLAVRTMI